MPPTSRLPLAMWAEVDGTFTNRQGMVQRLRAAIEPAGDSLPGWEILAELGIAPGRRHRARLTQEGVPGRPAETRLHEGRRVGPTILPVQLRFANTRG